MNAEYYKQRASEGGLIVTEATNISDSARGYPATPGINSQEQVEGWKKVVEGVHQKKGLIALQLWHVGRVSHHTYQSDGKRSIAPSEVTLVDSGYGSDVSGNRVPYETPREATLEDINEQLRLYKQAAANSKAAGFDGVELHAANGYLINQFLDNSSNKRTDLYGGSFENRARFLFQALDAVIEGFGNSRRVGIRLSPWGTFLEMNGTDKFEIFSYVLSRLNDYDLAYVHLVELGSPNTKEDSVEAMKNKSGYKKNLFVCGGYVKQTAQQVVDAKISDAVAFGQLFISNPDLPLRLKEDAPLTEPNPATFYQGGPKGYTDYPFWEPKADK